MSTSLFEASVFQSTRSPIAGLCRRPCSRRASFSPHVRLLQDYVTNSRANLQTWFPWFEPSKPLSFFLFWNFALWISVELIIVILRGLPPSLLPITRIVSLIRSEPSPSALPVTPSFWATCKVVNGTDRYRTGYPYIYIAKRIIFWTL